MSGHIDPSAFYASAGVLFAIALITAVARTAIRIDHFRRLSIDDGFLFLALTTLIAGSVLLFINVPASYTQQQVVAGLEDMPFNFLETLADDQRTQEAGTVLTSTTIVSVKYAFLFFFRRLLDRTNNRYLKWWWWFTLIVTTGCAPVFVFSDFIACPYTGDRILEKCIGPHAINRQYAILQTSVIMDIVTDVFIISIPTILLYPIRLTLSKKLTLSTVLCLSILMVICAIVRISMATTTEDKQINTLWVILWLELEACISVITVSVSAFNILFTAERNSGRGRASSRQDRTRRIRRLLGSGSRETGAGSPQTGVSRSTTIWNSPAASMQNPQRHGSIAKAITTVQKEERDEKDLYQLPPLRISLGLEMGLYLSSEFKGMLMAAETKDEPITPVTPVALRR